MRKIPTAFERDWQGDRSRVLDEIHPGCEWVFDGEGVATRKIDGTCAYVDEAGQLFKRYELKPSKGTGALPQPPAEFVPLETDPETGAIVGWVPVGAGPEDKWFREAYSRQAEWRTGTYELVGPKIQRNPEGYRDHVLLAHSDLEQYPGCPRTFEGLRAYLALKDIEGIVWHHPDGRMAKVKLRDFGLKRGEA